MLLPSLAAALLASAAPRPLVPPPATSAFVLTYTRPNDRALVPLWQELQREPSHRTRLAAFARRLRVPGRVPTLVQQCGEPDAHYDPNVPRIVICYELLAEVDSWHADLPAAERTRLRHDVFEFILFHEVGHALVDRLELPITGREEDAADQLATWVLATDASDAALTAVVHGASFFSDDADEAEVVDRETFAGEHGLDRQRYFNILCWAWGSAPDRFEDEITEAIPAARRARCGEEWTQLDRAWRRLLAGHAATGGGSVARRPGGRPGR